MTAGKDIHLQAARISSAGDMTIAGKRQVELGTAVAEKDNRVTWDRSNDRRDSTAMETGRQQKGTAGAKAQELPPPLV